MEAVSNKLRKELNDPGDNHVIEIRSSAAGTIQDLTDEIRQRTTELRRACTERRKARDCKIHAVLSTRKPSEETDANIMKEFCRTVLHAEGSFEYGFPSEPLGLLLFLLEDA